MIDKNQYQRTFGVLHASGNFLKEGIPMQSTKHFPLRKAALLCAALVLVFSMAAVCYAKDVGGIQRTVQIWVHGDQTNAVIDIQDGQYSLTYEDADGVTHERGGGGIAIEPDGSERPLTADELIGQLDGPEVEYKDDGSVWIYFRDRAIEITDKFGDDHVCFLQLEDGADTLYVTVTYKTGFAYSSKAYVQPEKYSEQ